MSQSRVSSLHLKALNSKATTMEKRKRYKREKKINYELQLFKARQISVHESGVVDIQGASAHPHI